MIPAFRAAAAPTSPAPMSLSRVRQYVELEIDRHGHRLAVMDIVPAGLLNDEDNPNG
jgi:hypothetical protein